MDQIVGRSGSVKRNPFRGRNKPKPLRLLYHDLVKSPHRTHMQSDCPLFSLIPAEVRNNIFELSVLRGPDRTAPRYPENSHFSRPGYRYPQRIKTSILQTCRRIYLETHLMPVEVNEHVFWGERGPPGSVAGDHVKAYFAKMTDEQRELITYAHFFTQLFWLEESFPTYWFPLRKIRITVRQGDWWWWENNRRLRINNEWGKSLRLWEGLEELELELETVEPWKDQLDAIVIDARKWKFPVRDGRVLSAEGLTPSYRRWLGPRCVENANVFHLALKQWRPYLGPIHNGPHQTPFVHNQMNQPLLFATQAGASIQTSNQDTQPEKANLPPKEYICYRCAQGGHWLDACPTMGDSAYDDKLAYCVVLIKYRALQE